MTDEERVNDLLKSLLYGPPQYFQGVNVGPFFSEEGYKAFYELDFCADDIIAITYAKCGTTYIQKLLHLLTNLDDNGNEIPSINSNGQIYPEWLHSELGHVPFTHVTIDQVLYQPCPRVFSTHMNPSLLPPGIKQNGKVVYMLRNPKDAYVSWHFMLSRLLRQKINWVPNENYQGTLLSYFPGPKNTMMYGDYFSFLVEMEKFAHDHLTGRYIVLYYEEFLDDFDTQLTKLADFLDIKLSHKKRAAISHKTSFNTMRDKAAGRQKILYRKGTSGDWKNYVDEVDESGPTPTPEQWSRFDEELDKLKNYEFARPLYKWM
ncbi:hypothetical protein THRCLA_20375 [Thraustotheca clavata]|uniref:Sulfotransferase domain-containing protein n=1 Tax=Thraustotheca clavata TaxID=74557 RepID=A0A1W0A8E6_9STRA|nr:hypothetical protein THRCLA_20375 [Thraustotheca clavata]